MQNKEILYRNVLIVSMNPLSDTLNNGKTMASFFKSYPKEHIAQIYFSPILPDSEICDQYFQISDMDMLRYTIKKDSSCGRPLDVKKYSLDNEKKDVETVKKVKKSQFSRLIREVLWGNRWKTKELIEWLDSYKPEIIFFTAGDVIFNYRICEFIRKRYNTKLVVFVTDDYVLPRKTVSIFWWLRRNYILKNMRDAVNKADKFITISDYMREVYLDFFKKDSFVAVNMTDSMKDEHFRQKDGTYELVYLGGLHYNRDTVLIKLSNILKALHDENGIDVKLKIYSAQELSNKEIEKLEISNISSFCGKVVGDEIKQVLNEADMLVHVESFKNKYDTKLSLSTKIPEYLSVGKPILAIGPNDIASMQYLEDVAFCINDVKKIKHRLMEYFYKSEEERLEFGRMAEKKYMERHMTEERIELFMRMLREL